MSDGRRGGRNWMGVCLAIAIGGISGAARAEEGMLPVRDLAGIDPAALSARGLTTKPGAMWTDRGGWLRAVARIGDCSGVVVSPKGLVLTSYACVRDAMPAAEAGKADAGFVARRLDEEISLEGAEMLLPLEIADVTEVVRSAIGGAGDDADGARALEKERARVAATCDAGQRCELVMVDAGRRYERHVWTAVRDLRLVWTAGPDAPAFLRAYVGADRKPAPYAKANVPLAAPHHVPLAAEGVQAGDGVWGAGYPLRAERLATPDEVRRQIAQVWPARRNQAAEVVDILGHVSGERDRDRERAAWLADARARVRDAELTLEGLSVVQAELHATAHGEAAARVGGDALPRWQATLADLVRERQQHFEEEQLLLDLESGPPSLAVGLALWDRARGGEVAWSTVRRAVGAVDVDADAELLAAIFVRAGRVVDPRRLSALLIAAADARGAGLTASTRATFADGARALLEGTRLGDPAWVHASFEAADPAALERAKARDPILALAASLLPEVRAVKEARALRAARERLAWSALEGARVLDVERDLRVGFGAVADGEGAREPASTTLTAWLADPGSAPLSGRVRAHASAGAASYWADPTLADVTVRFLATIDTVPGHEGSPAFDGRGRVVGIATERLPEGDAPLFAYSAHRSRAVYADVRFVLWMLDDVDDATELLMELGMASHRNASRRAPASGKPTPAPAPSAPPPADTSETPGCLCKASGARGPSDGAFAAASAVWTLFVVSRLRRRTRRLDSSPAMNTLS